MTALPDTPIVENSVWHSTDIASTARGKFTLSAAQCGELRHAIETLKQNRDLAGPGFGREDFILPGLAGDLEDISDETQNGCGFAVISGLDISPYSLTDLECLMWGLGLYLGDGIIQNKDGDLIGHVKDHGEPYIGGDPYLSGVRGYRTTVALPPHTDSCDLVGLLCVNKARSGGESSIVSALALFNEILETRPDLLPPLFEGFHIDLVGKGTADDQISFRTIPVFSYFGGKLSCRFNKRQIELGAEKSGRALTPLQQEAIDYFRFLSEQPIFSVKMDLVPGDIQFLNNRTTLHAREVFEDHEDTEQKRLMLRLWLNTPNGRPLAPEMADQLNTGPRGSVQVRL